MIPGLRSSFRRSWENGQCERVWSRSGSSLAACLPSVLGIQYDLGYKGRVRITIKQSFRFGSCGGALNSRGAHEDEATVILQFSMNKIATNDASIYNVDSSATNVNFEHWQFKRHRYECLEGPVFLLGPTRAPGFCRLACWASHGNFISRLALKHFMPRSGLPANTSIDIGFALSG